MVTPGVANSADYRFKKLASSNEVVAAILTNNGQVALFQRSQNVQGDKGLWHCITGFLSIGDNPEQQAKTEISEEAKIDPDRLKLMSACSFELKDKQGDAWLIHAYHYESLTRKIVTNWENDAAKWIHPDEINQHSTVSWLPDVIGSLNLNENRNSAQAG